MRISDEIFAEVIEMPVVGKEFFWFDQFMATDVSSLQGLFVKSFL